MSRYRDDTALKHDKQRLELELEEVNKKIETISELKKIFKNTYYKNLKFFLTKDGDWQHLVIEFDIEENEKPYLAWDDFEAIYDLGWHIFGTDDSCNVPKNRFRVLLRRNKHD